MAKIIYIDVETTGRDPDLCAIVQLGAIVEINGKEQERINMDIAPFPGATIDDKALEVIGKTREQIAQHEAQRTQYLKFVKILEKHVDRYNKADKFIFVGYNATFDDQFLRSFFKMNGNNYYGSYFHWPPVDVAVLGCVFYIEARGKMPNFKLETVAKRAKLEIKEDAFHDAFYDIELTKKLYKMFTQNI